MGPSNLCVPAAKLLNTLFDSAEALKRFKPPSLEKDITHKIVSLKSVIEKCVALPLSFEADFEDFAGALLKRPAAVEPRENSALLLEAFYKAAGDPAAMATLKKRLSRRSELCDEILSSLRTFMLESAPLSLPRKSHPVHKISD